MPKVQATSAAPGRGRGRRVATSLAEINVVPLVDVMLVLLIIFMVTAPMIQRGVDVNLPVSTKSGQIVNERVFVSVPLTFRQDRAVYLGAMLAPLALLPLLGGWDLLGVVPALAQNLLSADPVLYGFRAQYQSFVLPFLILAAVGGYARLARRRPGAWPVAVLVVAMVASLALASRTVNNLAIARFWPVAEQRAAYPVLARVLPAAAVSAQDPYVPHLSLRPLVFVFPVGIEKSDYVLVNLDTYPWRNLPDVTLTRDGSRVTIVAGGLEHRYEVAAQGGPHLLLRRL